MGNARNIAFWVVLLLLVVTLFNLFSGSGSTLQSREKTYSEFVTAVEGGQVSRVTLDGEQVRFTTSDGQTFGFEIDGHRKHCLINGLDDIGLTLEKATAIDAYEAKAAHSRPWA